MSIAAISAFTYFQTFNTFVLAMWTNSVASQESSTEHKSEVANEEYNSSQSFYLGLYCVAVLSYNFHVSWWVANGKVARKGG